jgi:hypothetical protein
MKYILSAKLRFEVDCDVALTLAKCLPFHVTLGIEDILFREERRVIFRPCVRVGVGRGRGGLKPTRERRPYFTIKS